MILREWAARWDIPFAALIELETQMGLHGQPQATDDAEKSEAWAQSAVRLEAAQRGILSFRNNVGVLPDETGRPVRYGLANDSKQLNQRVKSSDIILAIPKLVRPEHVGQTWGVFGAREIKPPGWVYTGTGREPAQLAFINLINAKGGDAAFATGPGSFGPLD